MSTTILEPVWAALRERAQWTRACRWLGDDDVDEDRLALVPEEF